MSEKKCSVYSKLLAVQQGTTVPKDRFNDYSNFNYRSAEDMLRNLKPLLAENNAVTFIEDEIVILGEPNDTYIKATVHFIDCETGDEITTSAYARESKHNNMSSDQCTITASSYARKQALHAMFLFDDGGTATDGQKQPKPKGKPNGTTKRIGGVDWSKQQGSRPPQDMSFPEPPPDDYDSIPLPEAPPDYTKRTGNRRPA